MVSNTHGFFTPRPGTSLYYALQTVPADQRDAAAAWVAWWHEVSQIPFSIRDEGVAETKLRWWQQELAAGAQGHATHPITRRLFSADDTSPPPARPELTLCQQQIDGLIQLIHQTRWLDEASLRRHMQATTGAACEAAACVLGASSQEARAAARQMGLGLRQAHHLARLGQDARAGWVHVPIDVLQAHDVKAHELTRPSAKGAPAGFAALLVDRAAQARASLHEGLAALSVLPAGEAKALRPLAVLARIALNLLPEIVQNGDRVLHERIVLTPLRKWWISTGVRWGLLR